jgi:hypothetical protein
MIIPEKTSMTIKSLLNSRLSRVSIIIHLLLFAKLSFCFSQNLYNQEHSQKYAEYLLSSQQHKLATEEYERLVYFDPSNINYKYNLIKSYRLSGEIKPGIRRIYSFYAGSLNTMPQNLATEFVKLEILSDSLSAAENFINQSITLSSDNKMNFHSFNLLLDGKYKDASNYLKTAKINGSVISPKVLLLSEKADKTKFKSPVLAASLSAIVPGTGKFYTGNWTDGLFSMIFVAGNAFQAYRGFSDHGIKSGYGWVFASFSTGFYIGNVYGSAKSAKRYNKIKKDEIDHQILDFIRSDNF